MEYCTAVHRPVNGGAEYVQRLDTEDPAPINGLMYCFGAFVCASADLKPSMHDVVSKVLIEIENVNGWTAQGVVAKTLQVLVRKALLQVKDKIAVNDVSKGSLVPLPDSDFPGVE